MTRAADLRSFDTPSFLDFQNDSHAENQTHLFYSVSEATRRKYNEVFAQHQKHFNAIRCSQFKSSPFATVKDPNEIFVATTMFGREEIFRDQVVRYFKDSDDAKKRLTIEYGLTAQYYSLLAHSGRPNGLIPLLFQGAGVLGPELGEKCYSYRDFIVDANGKSCVAITPNPRTALVDMLPAIGLLRDTPTKANVFAHVMYHLLDSLFCALAQLSVGGIVHGNISPASIFLLDEFGSFAVGAFEMARESYEPVDAAAPINSFFPPEDVLSQHAENDFQALDLYRIGRTLELVLGQDIRRQFSSEEACWEFIKDDFNYRKQLAIPEDFDALLEQRVDACADFRSLFCLIVAQACAIDPRERINNGEITEFFYSKLNAMLPVLSPAEALELEEFYRDPLNYKADRQFFEIGDDSSVLALTGHQARLFHCGVRRKAPAVTVSDACDLTHQQTVEPIRGRQ